MPGSKPRKGNPSCSSTGAGAGVFQLCCADLSLLARALVSTGVLDWPALARHLFLQPASGVDPGGSSTAAGTAHASHDAA